MTVGYWVPRRLAPVHRHHVCCFAPGCGTSPFSVPGPGLPGGRPGGLPGGPLGVDFGSRRGDFDPFPGLEVMIFHLRRGMTATRGITAVKAKVSLSLSLSRSLAPTTHRLRGAQRTPDRLKPKQSFRCMLLSFVTRRLSRCILSRVVSPPAASHRGASHLGCSNSARGELPLHSLRFMFTLVTLFT